MKRLLAILVTLSALFALSACGSAPQQGEHLLHKLVKGFVHLSGRSSGGDVRLMPIVLNFHSDSSFLMRCRLPGILDLVWNTALILL